MISKVLTKTVTGVPSPDIVCAGEVGRSPRVSEWTAGKPGGPGQKEASAFIQYDEQDLKVDRKVRVFKNEPPKCQTGLDRRDCDKPAVYIPKTANASNHVYTVP